MNKKKKSKKKIIITIAVIIGFLAMVGGNKDDSDVSEDITESEIVQTEESSEPEEVETDVNGWSIHDYTEFDAALKTIAKEYLVNYKLPLWNKWTFMKFDDERIIAMTEELTFKDEHEKHTVICVFMLSGDVDENGFHNEIKWSYFATDEKEYFNDGTCDAVFEILKQIVK